MRCTSMSTTNVSGNWHSTSIFTNLLPIQHHTSFNALVKSIIYLICLKHFLHQHYRVLMSHFLYMRLAEWGIYLFRVDLFPFSKISVEVYTAIGNIKLKVSFSFTFSIFHWSTSTTMTAIGFRCLRANPKDIQLFIPDCSRLFSATNFANARPPCQWVATTILSNEFIQDVK